MDYALSSTGCLNRWLMINYNVISDDDDERGDCQFCQARNVELMESVFEVSIQVFDEEEEQEVSITAELAVPICKPCEPSLVNEGDHWRYEA